MNNHIRRFSCSLEIIPTFDNLKGAALPKINYQNKNSKQQLFENTEVKKGF